MYCLFLYSFLYVLLYQSLDNIYFILILLSKSKEKLVRKYKTHFLSVYQKFEKKENKAIKYIYL